MKQDFTKILLNLDGTPTEREPGKPITLGDVIVNALLSSSPNEQQTGVDKFRNYQLAMRIHGKSEVEVTAEEVALIKQAVGKFNNPLVVGRTYDMLEDK